MSNVRGIHLIGASGTGKTTLVNYIADRYGFTKLPSAARTTMKEFGLNENEFAKILADLPRYEDFQMEVAKKQKEMEEQTPVAFVSDRAFDHLAYAALYGTIAHRLVCSGYVADYLKALSQDRIIFLIRPTRVCLEKALLDGDRKEYLVWEDMHRFDGILQFIAETNAIPYHPITTSDIRERKRVIDNILHSHGVLPSMRK